MHRISLWLLCGFFTVIYCRSSGRYESHPEDVLPFSDDEYQFLSSGDETFTKKLMLDFEEPSFWKELVKNENEAKLFIFNQRTSDIILYKEFPLAKLLAVWMDFKRHMQNVAPERIIVLHVEGPSVLGLRNATVYLTSLGSLLVEHLDDYSTWLWIFTFGGKTLFERATFYGDVDKTKQWSHVMVPLSNVPNPIAYTSKEKARWEYCGKYGGMGDLCDEVEPALLLPVIATSPHNINLSSIPVIITGGNRPKYLYQSLKSYFNSPGVVKENFHVVLGENSSATTDLLDILSINYKIILPSQYGESNFFPFLFYKQTYQFTFDNFKSAPYIIFLEEDIEVSRNFFSYISQTAPILARDSTIYCVTAFSHSGLKGLAYNVSSLLRANIQVGWGYALTPTFIEEALLQWPITNIAKDLVYDGWLYKFVRGERECVYPEVSRTRHFGMGLNTHFWLAERTFLTMPVVEETNVTVMDVGLLELSAWNQHLREEISAAIQVNKNPCKANYPKSLSPGSYTLFYKFNSTDKKTYDNFYFLGSCFDAWVYSEQGQHDYVDIFQLAPHVTLYFVADPQSPFSVYRSKHIPPMDVHTFTTDEMMELKIKSVENIQVGIEYYEPLSSRNLKEIFFGKNKI